MAGEDGDIHSLGGTAAAVWDLLDRPRSIAEITDALSRWYQGPPAQVRQDVVSLIGELQRQRFVQQEQEPDG